MISRREFIKASTAAAAIAALPTLTGAAPQPVPSFRELMRPLGRNVRRGQQTLQCLGVDCTRLPDGTFQTTWRFGPEACPAWAYQTMDLREIADPGATSAFDRCWRLTLVRLIG